MSPFRARRMRRFAVAMAIGGLLLNVATPLLAATAAAMLGVPVGEICDVYGFRLPEAPHATTTSTSMPSHAHAMPDGTTMDSGDDEAMSMAMPDDGTSATDDEATGADGRGVAPAVGAGAPTHDHHSHSLGLHGAGDHCALTALATFAPPALPPAPPVAPSAQHVAVATTASDRVPFDAVSTWAFRQKRGPPATA